MSQSTLATETGVRQAKLRDAARSVAGYLAAAALATLGAVWVMRLWRADLSVPFSYDGDAALCLGWVKGVLDNPWCYRNPFVGMPFGQEMHDFPLIFVDSFQFLLMKLLGLVSPDYAVVGNLYFVATFPLSTLTALFVLRRLGATYLPALVAAMLFAFLPYHFMRGQAHLFLASYYMVPLSVLVALWLFLEPEAFFRRRWARLLPAVLICAVVASSGVYYAYFSCFFFLVAGLAAACRAGRVRASLPAMAMTGVVSLGVAANLAPVVAYQLKHGRNPEAVVRYWAEAEYYGLKITQLLLPVPGHRVEAMAALPQKYHRPQPVPLCNNENTYAALGAVGAAGFLFLLARLFWVLSGRGVLGVLDALCTLNVAAVLLGTMGGIGSALALLGCSWIRGYNRLSVFIGFFALAAVALLLAELCRRLPKSRLAFSAQAVGLGLLLALGLLDQTAASFIPPHADHRAVYTRERDFICSVEASVPAQAMIFQLPYVPFVEHGPPHLMMHYDHCRAYLHSKSLRWSYGAMKGRASDVWQRWVASRPVPEFLRTLTLAGFSGVYVDRHGYPDAGANVERQLVAELGRARVEDPGKRFVFYSLDGFTEKLRRLYSEPELLALQEEARNPLQVTWGGLFSPQEGAAPEDWRWCGSEGVLTLTNPAPEARQYELRLALRYWQPKPARVTISGGLLSGEFVIDQNTPPIQRTVIIPPGTHRLNFRCDGERIPAPADPRQLVFRVVGFSARRSDWTSQAMAP